MQLVHELRSAWISPNNRLVSSESRFHLLSADLHCAGRPAPLQGRIAVPGPGLPFTWPPLYLNDLQNF